MLRAFGADCLRKTRVSMTRQVAFLGSEILKSSAAGVLRAKTLAA
jgi:hypothetical protein